MAMIFTALADWDHLQDRAAANEIIAAYSERRQAIEQSAISPILVSGDNAHNTQYWKAIQQWIDSNLYYFVNHTVPINGAASVTMFFTSTFMAEAGIPSGWRRATAYDPAANDWTNPNDAMYSHSQITSGDIRGPWIFEDLQKAMDTLKWTRRGASRKDIYDRGSVYSYGPDCGTVRQAAIDAYNAASWQSGGANLYRVEASHYGTTWGCSRTKGKLEETGIPIHVPHAADQYAMAEAGFNDFDDIDGIGAVEDRLFLVESYTSATTATRTTAQFNPRETNPIEARPLTCSDPDGVPGCQIGGHLSGTTYRPLIVKWAFSHTL